MSGRSQELRRHHRSLDRRAPERPTALIRRLVERPAGRAFGLVGLLLIVTIWVYLPVVQHPFVNYDDPDYVTDNSHVQQGLTLSTIPWAFTTMESANWHPLTWLSHAADCELFGLHPSGHHATSLTLHALNTVLLFLLLWKATEKLGRSLFVASLFAVHPINVETVAWVAERKSVLCMLFILLTLLAYGWYARIPDLRRSLVVMLFFALALLAKPLAVTLPFALLLLDLWPLQRLSLRLLPGQSSLTPQRSLSALVREKLPLLAMAAASCAITLHAQRQVIKPLQIVPLDARVLNAVYSYVAYIAKAFWPAHLAVFYAQRGSHLGVLQVIVCITMLAAVSALAWRYRSRPYFFVGWL